jgi:hypothetical protein
MNNQTRLTTSQARKVAGLALTGIVREFPHKPDHVLNSAADALTPRRLHPAFYGCYDWHSSVHSHWLLVRLMNVAPELPEANEIRKLLARHLSAANLESELAYVMQPGRASFERPYGWAWFFKLTEELLSANDMHDESAAVRPLAECFAERLIDWLVRVSTRTRLLHWRLRWTMRTRQAMVFWNVPPARQRCGSTERIAMRRSPGSRAETTFSRLL